MQTESKLTPFWRFCLYSIVNLSALFVYALGLLAPLTPSEGLPSVPVLLLFVGLPVVLLVGCIRAVGATWLAAFFGLQILALLAFTVYLLLLQSGVFAS